MRRALRSLATKIDLHPEAFGPRILHSRGPSRLVSEDWTPTARHQAQDGMPIRAHEKPRRTKTLKASRNNPQILQVLAVLAVAGCFSLPAAVWAQGKITVKVDGKVVAEQEVAEDGDTVVLDLGQLKASDGSEADLEALKALAESPGEDQSPGSDADLESLKAMAERPATPQAESAALDPGEGLSRQSIAAAKIIAEREQVRREDALKQVKLQRLSTYEYEIIGAEMDPILADAKLRALKTTAARLYFGKYVIIGRHLLEPYLRNNLDKFVPKLEVLERGRTSAGDQRVRVKVYVDRDLLYVDLEHKHFIGQPKFRPSLAITLEETLSGRVSRRGQGRFVLERELSGLDMRLETEPITPGIEITDISASAEKIGKACAEAQRMDVDIVLSGSVISSEPEQRIILFDEHFFVEGTLSLKAYRVDNGEAIRTIFVRESVSAKTKEAATDAFLERIATRAAAEFSDGFVEMWEGMMLEESDYRLLITGIDRLTLDGIARELTGISPTVQLYVKSYYGESAVVNLIYPDAQPGEVESHLRRARAPQFRILPAGKGNFELIAL